MYKPYNVGLHLPELAGNDTYGPLIKYESYRKQKGKRHSIASITKMETKVELWMNKEQLTAIDLLAIQPAKRKLEMLDAEFRGNHVAVVGDLENNEDFNVEKAVLNDYDKKVTYITVHLDPLSNCEDTSVSAKLEGETQHLLHKRLSNIEKSIRGFNLGIEHINSWA